MPDNIPTWLDQIIGSKLFVSFLLSVVVAALRIIYDKEETKPVRIAIEAALCGALTLTVGYAIMASGLNENWAMFAGGSIALLGVETIRGLILRFITKKVDDK